MPTLIAILAVVAVVALVWRFSPRRPGGPGFQFVYVNQDGSVRELSPAEQAYLSAEFSGGDGGRPYIKDSYQSRDGWGSLSGFIERRYVPAHVRILLVHPDYDAREKKLGCDELGSYRAAGDLIEARADGAVVCTPNPNISRSERFELARRWQLALQRERERLAAMPDARSEDKSNV